MTEAEEQQGVVDKKIVHISEERIKDYLDGQVRQSVEDTLNALLDAEADEICGAKRYERSPDRMDTRAGHYERGLHTKAGEVKLKVPKLRSLPFESQIMRNDRKLWMRAATGTPFEVRSWVRQRFAARCRPRR